VGLRRGRAGNEQDQGNRNQEFHHAPFGEQGRSRALETYQHWHRPATAVAGIVGMMNILRLIQRSGTASG
jgi:hypothetical protein